jgi:hypothetical protein
MSRMKRTAIVALLLVAGCDRKETAHDSCCSAPAPAVQRSITRADGILLTGLPDSPELAACDTHGRWGLKTPAIAHWIVDPTEKAPLLPEENHPIVGLFRDSIPFPQTNWKAGDWEVTQLLFPVGKGFVVRYHVMNHGEDAHAAQLNVGTRENAGADSPLIATADKPAAATLKFDLKIEPGVSQFIHVTTPDLAGKFSEDALDQATAAWEKLLGSRALLLPDPAACAAYYNNLAGQILGVAGCAEAAVKTEQMLAKKEGNGLRLLSAIPEKWNVEAIEARELPTDFGPLSFKYQGAYNNRRFEFKPGCKPPDGFLIAVPEKLVARIDGKDAPVKDGLLRVPAGAVIVELSYPR